MSVRLLGAKQRFNKERFQLAENLRSARCSHEKIEYVRKTDKRTARMLANARKDHSIPLSTRNHQILVLPKKENTFVCLFLYLNNVEHMYSLRNGKRAACNYRVMDARGCIRLLNTKEA